MVQIQLNARTTLNRLLMSISADAFAERLTKMTKQFTRWANTPVSGAGAVKSVDKGVRSIIFICTFLHADIEYAL